MRKNAEIFYLCRPKSIPTPLHRKKHYDQRRWLMKQPFEVQEKAQRRLDYFFYAIIAAAVVVAMSFSLFKNHNIGRAVLFFLFLIWWTYFALKSDLHRIAKMKGWETVAKMTYDPKAEKPREEATLREERLKTPIDTETLIVMENVTNLEDLEAILFDYVEVECNTLCDDLPQLWKVGEYRYAVTFPCGISRKPLYELMDNLICFLDSATVYGWCRPDLFKKKGDGWLFLRNGDEDMLVAYSDDGTLWDIDATDAILRNPRSANGFCEYPTIDWDPAEQLGVYY